ncbi:MAG TPA: MBL fold metallo-hydrolase [bacterium]|nr:MBL fold metallo-hydrolase [bacterium]
MATVKILIEGYAHWIEDNKKQKASGTITLIKGSVNCIVDTGNVGDATKIEKTLKKESIDTKDINVVINTHGDIDHVGNNSLFTKASFIGGHDIVSDGDVFTFFEGEYEISKDVKVISTPGHSIEDISVLVDTDEGLVAITGDLFESENDIKDQSWRHFSNYPKEQIKSRKQILEIADWVVPGHGKMFKVGSKHKSSK